MRNLPTAASTAVQRSRGDKAPAVHTGQAESGIILIDV